MEGSGRAVEAVERSIQRKALELGYGGCGVIPVRMLDGYREKLGERIEKVVGSGAFYEGQQHLAHFEREFPWARSVVVLVVPYARYRVPEVLSGHIAKAYLLDTRIDERTEEYRHSQALEAYMRHLGLRVAIDRKFGVVALRWAAMQAGLGVVRRNNFFYTGSGSWLRIEAFLTDREMELREESDLPPCPKGCDRCAKACPTASLCEAYTMDPLRCISFLTTFGGRDLPDEPLAKRFGDWIYGCDACQEACPMNHGKWIGDQDFPGLTELSPSLAVEDILTMDEGFYRQRVQPKFFYLAPDELWKLQVNTLNFMDNRYHERFKPTILKARESTYGKVREMAAAICERRHLQVDG